METTRWTWLLLAVIAIGALDSLDAQIQVQLEMDRRLYLAHEPVTGTLTIVNRAGRDLVFGESDGLSWLDFTVTDGRGHLITPIRGIASEPPIVLASGQTYRHEVTVNRYYPMAQIGVYRVKASIHFPQIKRVFTTTSETVQITDGQPMWSQIVGVPQGHPEAGSYREYALMTYYHGARNKSLYFRLRDNDSGMVYKTYPIGDYMSIRPPQHAIDRQNQLHILHMSAPQKYTYTVVNVDGIPKMQREYYEKNADRPELVSNDFGEVRVEGGITAEEASVSYEETEFPRLSERPPGMPTF